MHTGRKIPKSSAFSQGVGWVRTPPATLTREESVPSYLPQHSHGSPPDPWTIDPWTQMGKVLDTFLGDLFWRDCNDRGRVSTSWNDKSLTKLYQNTVNNRKIKENAPLIKKNTDMFSTAPFATAWAQQQAHKQSLLEERCRQQGFSSAQLRHGERF